MGGGRALNRRKIALVIVDTLNHDLARLAIEKSASIFSFDRVLILSDRVLDKRFENYLIPSIIGKEDYNRFVLESLPDYISEDYCIVIQYDGFVINESRWSEQFLEFDYIGAVWPNYPFHRVGNGGFSLRSKRFMDVAASFAKYRKIGEAEDVFVSRTIRPLIESIGKVRFAPEPVAASFSFESPGQNRDTFGFHGVFNLPFVYGTRIREFVAAASLSLCQERLNELHFGSLFLNPQSRVEFLELLSDKIAASRGGGLADL